MMRRPVNAFSLSFLDCMCCGFGAIILVFILIIHRVSETTAAVTGSMRAETMRAELRVDALRSALAEETAALHSLDAEEARLDAELARIAMRLEQAAAEAQAKPVPTRDPQAPRPVVGRGHEVQLIGLKTGGRRNLILVDSSASMLDPTIVGIVRRRHLPAAEQRRAPKWRQAVAAVDWLVERLPARGEFQIYTFAGDARPVIEGTGGRWLDAGDEALRQRVRAGLRTVVPDGGTSLHAAFETVAALRPRPDNVYLLVDGLPTRGSERPRQTTVTGRERMAHFADAVRRLPRGVTVNVLLYPLEGDPRAVSAYWDLTIATNGALLSPSEEWP